MLDWRAVVSDSCIQEMSLPLSSLSLADFWSRMIAFSCWRSRSSMRDCLISQFSSRFFMNLAERACSWALAASSVLRSEEKEDTWMFAAGMDDGDACV